jgi:hypothetical protein
MFLKVLVVLAEFGSGDGRLAGTPNGFSGGKTSLQGRAICETSFTSVCVLKQDEEGEEDDYSTDQQEVETCTPVEAL